MTHVPTTSTAVVQGLRLCRDCDRAVPGNTIYCDRHRVVRRSLTFLNQALIAASQVDAPLTERIQLAIERAEAL